jgi:hypothetical protein
MLLKFKTSSENSATIKKSTLSRHLHSSNNELLIINLTTVPAECVTNEKDWSSFQCCIKDEGRPLIYALRKE